VIVLRYGPMTDTGFDGGAWWTRALLLGATLTACSGTSTSPSQGAPVGTTACGGETRPQIDCSSEGQGALEVGTFAKGRARYEETALRRVDEETARYLALQSRLCRDYNACALDKDSYQKESRAVRDRLSRIPELRDALGKAASDGDKVKAVDAIYRSIVPAEKRVEEVAMSLGVEADLPGGKHVLVPQGGSLPTDTRLAFHVQVSAEAYVYVFQLSPDGSLTVLFPNERIGTRNPLAAGAPARIPPGGASFRLNEKDVGIEKVFVAVSRREIARLGDALARVNAGQVRSLAGDETLQTLGSVGASAGGKPCARASAPPPPPALAPPRAAGGQPRPVDTLAGSRELELVDDGCARPRGLEFVGGPDAGVRAATIVARTEPGDALIIKVFTFEHLTPQAFAAKGGGN
jgi:hypothetical protein